jgi:hypothetical protein
MNIIVMPLCDEGALMEHDGKTNSPNIWHTFVRSEAVIVGSSPALSMDVQCIYISLCLCCPVFR